MPVIVQSDADAAEVGGLRHITWSIIGRLVRFRNAVIDYINLDPDIIVGGTLDWADTVRVRNSIARGQCPDCGGRHWDHEPDTAAMMVATPWRCCNKACGSRFTVFILNTGPVVVIDRVSRPSPLRRYNPATASLSKP